MTTIVALGFFLVASHQPRELGKVAFERDFEVARARALASGKPMLVLFDEVPGCHNCTSFGDTVLSDDLIVAAADSAFVPVAVYNNHDGADRLVLERFKEPPWNNPVVRIMDAEGRDLAPRLADTYEKEALARQMVAALTGAKREVPGYLRALADEADAHQPLYVSMGCFWSGEACLGALDGVASTRTGFLEGHEVVEVLPAHGHDAASVAKRALGAGCAIAVYASTPAQREALVNAGVTAQLTTDTFRFSATDDKYSLRSHVLARVGLTPVQATRVNAALAAGRDPLPWLTPRQAAQLRR